MGQFQPFLMGQVKPFLVGQFHRVFQFSASLAEGDTVVICSYVGLFASLSAYLTTAVELMERGVVIESLQEPAIVINNANREFVRELNALSRRLRSSSSLKSIHKLKVEGKRLGRPPGSTSETQNKVAQIDKLCKQSSISVVKACKVVGCLPRTYYRLKSKEAVGSYK